MKADSNNIFLVFPNVAMLIFLSGSIFGMSLFYKQAVYIVLGCTFLFALQKGRMTLKNNAIGAFIILSFLVLCVPLINNVSFSSYVAIVLQMLMALIFTSNYSFRSFRTVYCKIMLFLAIVSLICFFLYVVYPDIALLFPKTIGNASLDYYNAGIYVFGSAKGYGTFTPFYRNMGIFWEPGCYQAFINLSLFFYLSSFDKIENFEKSKVIAIFMIYALTIVTTLSTTGIIVFCIILVYYYRKIRDMIDLKSLGFMLVSLVIVFVCIINFVDTSFLSEKIQREFGVAGNAFERLALSNLRLIIRDPISFLGLSFERYAQHSGNILGNSLVQSLISLGFTFTIILMTMYYRFSKRFRFGWVLFVILCMFFLTESLLWRPIFLCLAWYGIEGDAVYG